MGKVNAVRLRAVLGVFAVLPLLLLAGCVETPPKPAPPSYAQLYQQAQASEQQRDHDAAKRLYNQAAASAPTNPAPWLQLARIEFSEQDYGRAIVAAREVLQRDPVNEQAQSLLTISGLRVAVQAVDGLRGEDNPKGPAHLEAEQLVDKMREVLGEGLLVPPASKKRARVRRAAAPRTTAPGMAEKKPPPSSATPANPFQALPGSSSD